MNTLIVNLYGGPGTGKSRIAAGIFSKLKFKNINCEYVSEFAKDVVWEERHETLKDQLYISAKQYHKLHRLIGKVSVIITDSPILLGAVYGDDLYLNELVKSLHAKHDSYDVFLNRVNPYNPRGRTQTEVQAIALDTTIRDIWKAEYTEYTSTKTRKFWDTFDAFNDAVSLIVNKIMSIIIND
jgi:hypothetical protein